MISPSDILHLQTQKDVDKYTQKHYSGDINSFISDINSSVNRLLQTDITKVKKFVKELSPLFKILPAYHRPRLLAMKARFEHWSGRSKIARRYYRQAIEQLLIARNFDAAARARQGLMDVHMYLGDYSEALEIGRKALDYFRRKGNENNAARVMTNIGNIYHRLDRNSLSLRYYNRAREFFVLQGGVPLAILDFNRANIYTNLNRLDKAEYLYQSAANIFQKCRMDLAAGKAKYSLAYLYFLKDQYTMALKVFNQVIEIFDRTGDLKSITVSFLDLAEINTHLNQFGSAVMMGDKAIAICKKLRLRYEEAKAAYFVAEAYRQLGDNNLAARYLKRAEKLFLLENNKLWLGMVNIAGSRLKLSTRRYAEAHSKAAEAYSLFRQSGDKRRSIDAQIATMEAYLLSKSPHKAVQLGMRLINNQLVNYQRHLILYIIGRAYLNLSQPKTALSFLCQAIDVIEKMLQNIYPDEIRYFFALDKYPTYLSAVDCLLQMDCIEDSFLQHSRALAILNQRPILADLLNNEVPEHLLEIRSNLRAKMNKLGRIPDNDQREAVSGKGLIREEHRLWDTERKIRSYLYPSSGNQKLPKPIREDYPDLIKKDEILVNFFSTDQMVGAFCVNRGSTRYVSCPVQPQALEDAVRKLHFLMEMTVHSPAGIGQNSEVVDYYCRRLYCWLIEPLKISESTQRMVIMIDGLFAQLPFAAFKDSRGRLLKDQHPIRIIVNPDDLKNKSRSLNISDHFRSAVFVPPNSGLPAAEREGLNIKNSFEKAHLYRGEDANIANLQKELKQASGFVHIATHASRSSENPLFSRIMMNDGPFFPFDLFGSGIKARLVTLSGCQTAAPGIYYGNSFSLAKAFYTGGANCVLASLWPISDKISLVFMTEFYRSLKTDKNTFKAYRKALNKTCEINNNPAFWAPFIMLGK